MKEVLEYLNNKNIKYELVNHPPALTTEEADEYVKGKEGVLTKTLFMAGKKDKKFYLFITDDKKRINIKKMNEIVGNKLHFGKKQDLLSKLGLKPGAVSIYGLLNNKEHDINVYIDEEITKEKIITFHPNDNTATLFILIEDMFNFLEDLDYDYNIIEF